MFARVRIAVVLVVVAVPSLAAAQQPAPPTPPTAPDAPSPAPAAQPAAPAPPTFDAKALERRLAALEDENSSLREDVDFLSARLEKALPATRRITGYVDLGMFAVSGGGAGTRTDVGNLNFPEYAGVVPGSWVFMGDPLSTAINSRGEPADTGESRAVTFDPVNSHGHPSFLVNAVNLTIFAPLGDALLVNSSVDFVPRARDVSDPSGLFLGDFIDVKLAYAEYRVHPRSFKLSLYAGKMESVVGYEYRTQDSPYRLGITPSLICRYTCGRPLGVKARAQFLDERLVVNTSVTNGDHFVEQFPLNNEIDANDMKTGAARVSYRFRVGTGLEVGASGAAGAQDAQPSNDVLQWHTGLDAHLGTRSWDVTGEVVHGRATGQTEPGGVRCGLAQCLTYKGAYLQAGYRVSNRLTPYLRTDWRDALHQSGDSFVYISKLMRVTAGIRYEPFSQFLLKAEYIVNRELGRIPQFPDDVFTTSAVLGF